MSKHRNILSFWRFFTVIALCLFNHIQKQSCFAGGVTVITHGNGGNTDSWVSAMAARIREYAAFPGTDATLYRIYFVITNGAYQSAWERLGGSNPLSTDSGEIIVLFDWRQLANSSYNTRQIAPHVTVRLIQTNFIEELGGRALAELPIHIIGHSRGGSLVSESVRMLGTNGVWVDHQTTLDGYSSENDATLTNTYENVLFHDNTYQSFYFNVHGFAREGAYNRYLGFLPAGYWPDYFGDHSDVHLWYHGTIALETPTSDSLASIQTIERMFWWSAYEQKGTNAGFIYSLIGGANRMSTDRPGGLNTDEVRAGFNQHWELGAGISIDNRATLSPIQSGWPNIIRFNLTGANAIVKGGSSTAKFYYQWARPSNETADVTVYLDRDANAWNENEQIVSSATVHGTTSSSVASQTLTLVTTHAYTQGTYRVLAKITGSGKTRYFYAPELLTIIGPLQPPLLGAKQQTGGNIQIRVNGVIGQRIVVEKSETLVSWRPIATNTLANSYWNYIEATTQLLHFYRAVVR